MVRARFASSTLLALFAVFVLACADDGELAAQGAPDGGLVGGDVPLPPGCMPMGNDVPQQLACTGLYGSGGTVEKAVPPQVWPFSPAVPLWSDGAEKQRWLHLPDGKTIDTSKPGFWTFPVGTRAWKEFKHNGKRVETRFFYKLDVGIWRTATYLWNDTETAAERFAGGDVPVAGGTYHVPTGEECEQCHRGSKDQLLGLEPLLLGLPGAEGLTLKKLSAENRLSPPLTRTEYSIPDDGTGLQGPVLGWLHVNCGVSCHNENESSNAYPSRMYLRLNPTMFEGMPLSEWNPIKTTRNQVAHTSNFAGATRLIPGAPEDSLMVQLAMTRGSSRAMPPIASRVIDQAGVDRLREWITRLGGAKPDAGMDAGVPDSGMDAAVPNTGIADAKVADAEVVDAEVPDAQLADAEIPDAGLPEVVDTGVPEVVDTGVPEVVDTGVPEVVDTGVPEVVDTGVPEVVDTGVPEVVDTGVPEVVDTGVPEVVDTGVPEVVDTGVPEVVPPVVPEDIDAGVPEVVPPVVPEDIDTGVPEVVPPVVPEVIDAGVPEVVPPVVPEVVPPVVPEVVDAGLPEVVPPAVPEVVPPVVPEVVPPVVPEVVDAGIPEVVPPVVPPVVPV